MFDKPTHLAAPRRRLFAGAALALGVAALIFPQPVEAALVTWYIDVSVSTFSYPAGAEPAPAPTPYNLIGSFIIDDTTYQVTDFNIPDHFTAASPNDNVTRTIDFLYTPSSTVGRSPPDDNNTLNISGLWAICTTNCGLKLDRTLFSLNFVDPISSGESTIAVNFAESFNWSYGTSSGLNFQNPAIGVSGSGTISTTAPGTVPEPGSLALLCIGLVGLLSLRTRKVLAVIHGPFERISQ